MARGFFGGLFDRTAEQRQLRAKGQGPSPSAADTGMVRRDVLVGALRSREQLKVCLGRCFYHIPVKELAEVGNPDDVKYIALYQSRRVFGSKAGIRHWGPVDFYELLSRRDITELPKDSDEPYYRFRMADWWELTRPISPGDASAVPGLTSRFLLERSASLSELWLQTEDEFRLYNQLRRVLASPALNLSNMAFTVGGAEITISDGVIRASRGGVLLARSTVGELHSNFDIVFRLLRDALF